MILVQIVIKATVLLESVGAYVYKFMSNWAQTNGKISTEFGIDEKLDNCRNYIEHFVGINRKFFGCSDIVKKNQIRCCIVNKVIIVRKRS